MIFTSKNMSPLSKIYESLTRKSRRAQTLSDTYLVDIEEFSYRRGVYDTLAKLEAEYITTWDHSLTSEPWRRL